MAHQDSRDGVVRELEASGSGRHSKSVTAYFREPRVRARSCCWGAGSVDPPLGRRSDYATDRRSPAGSPTGEAGPGRRRSAGATLEPTALALRQPAPDPEPLVMAQGVLQAVAAHGAASAHALGLSVRAALLREEGFGVGLRAERFFLPGQRLGRVFVEQETLFRHDASFDAGSDLAVTVVRRRGKDTSEITRASYPRRQGVRWYWPESTLPAAAW